jgi:hypothetical protein
MASKASKPLRVQASAIPAADVPGYWLPVIVSIDPEIRRSPLGNAVIPELCARMETALSRAERIVSREYSTWKRRRDGWRVAPDGDALLPDHDRAPWRYIWPAEDAAAAA